MTKDDRVTVPLMPHLGIGVVEMVLGEPFDRILVRFRIEGSEEPYLSEFAPAELQPAPTVARTA